MRANNLFFCVAIIFAIFCFGGVALAEGPQCYLGDSTNSTYCQSLSTSEVGCEFEENCWNANGCCFANDSWNNMGSTGGCWQNDGNKDSCQLDTTCSWSANNLNQDPWCMIKTLADAQYKNVNATSLDIGCCMQKGCWNFDGDPVGCEAAFGGGLCHAMTNDLWCPNCCEPKACGEILDAATCGNMSKVNAPCNWDEGEEVCNFPGNGGFAYWESPETCTNSGGWWNASSEMCIPPSMGDFNGGGGFMFGGGFACWFADGNEKLCTNMTGCAYCAAGTGEFGIANTSALNICYGATAGLCEGHDTRGSQQVGNADNSRNLQCSDFNLKQACLCGPMPDCTWNSSENTQGAYCAAGVKTQTQQQLCMPPTGISGAVVTYCEHPDALNNQTLCGNLSENYLMPCTWDVTQNKCKFNLEAAFGEAVDSGYNNINSETSCIAAGGTWKQEYYVEDGILKQDSWCEKGAMFDFGNGVAFANKGNCDTDCWACEFNSTGQAWANVAAAEAACVGSSLGYCKWTTDSYAPNNFGWCDYPEEFSYGASMECSSDCNACDFMVNPYDSCLNSGAGCSWVNDTNNPNNGYCLSNTKKTCDSDCFSCYDQSSCFASDLDCTWEDSFALCKPSGYNGEVCFDGIDNDNDNAVDCADVDCSFDNFCGGGVIADCFKYSSSETCEAAEAFNGKNCTWVQFDWEPVGHCDMPGSNCWMFNGDTDSCNAEEGCMARDMGENAFCQVNSTKITGASCFSKNAEQCAAAPLCTWIIPEYEGAQPFCDFYIFSLCMSRNSTTCEQDSNCTWEIDAMTGGWCDPACFSITDVEECNSHASGVCDAQASMCEPENFMGLGGGFGAGAGPFMMQMGCPKYNGNYTGCMDSNVSCSWSNDTYIANNVTPEEYSGWCNDKASDRMFNGFEGKSNIIGGDGPDDLPGYVDLYDLRVKDLPESYTFAMALSTNGSKYSAACNGYKFNSEYTDAGTGSNTSKYFIYLDTDGVNTGSCCANSTTGNGFTENCGFEFLISVVSRNNSGSLEDTKKLSKCVDAEWVSTNIPISLNKLLTYTEGAYDGCIYGTPLIGVEKETLEGFKDIYDRTKPLRLLALSANDTFTKENPQDSIGPVFYTPGTTDFGFVDCSNPNVKDPKCKNFQKFGFNLFEDCHSAGDEDLNGFEDCADPFCANKPICGGTFTFTVNTSDKSTPVITFSNVEKMHNAAYIKFDTNEPANGTVLFYSTNSGCADADLNATINDLGDPSFAFDDYKPFHWVPLEEETLGYELTNGTVYYYKAKVCDPSSNCGLSSCLNFTTQATAEYKQFIFKMDLPEGYTVDIPALGLDDFNFSSTIGGIEYEVGVKTNSSVTRDINITVNCGDLHLMFDGVDIMNPKDIDLETAFICDQQEETLGMNSSTKGWNKVMHELGLGGYSDSIILEFPLTYDADNNIEWCDDNVESCEEVTNYVTCEQGSAITTECTVPTSLGFSTYRVTTPAGATTTTGGGGGSGSGKSGGAAVTPQQPEELEGDLGVASPEEDGFVDNDGGVLTEKGIESSWPWIIAAVVIAVAVLLVVIISVLKKRH